MEQLGRLPLKGFFGDSLQCNPLFRAPEGREIILAPWCFGVNYHAPCDSSHHREPDRTFYAYALPTNGDQYSIHVGYKESTGGAIVDERYAGINLEGSTRCRFCEAPTRDMGKGDDRDSLRAEPRARALLDKLVAPERVEERLNEIMLHLLAHASVHDFSPAGAYIWNIGVPQETRLRMGGRNLSELAKKLVPEDIVAAHRKNYDDSR